MANTELKILVKTEAETGGIDQVKGKLQEIKGVSDQAAASAEKLGAAIGTGIGGIAVGAVASMIAAWRAFEAEEQRVFEEMERGREVVQRLQEDILGVQDAMIQLSLIKALPIADAMIMVEQNIIRLKTEMSLLNVSIKEEAEEWKKDSAELQKNINLRESLINQAKRQQDIIKQTRDQIALNIATGNEEATTQAKVQQAYDQKLRALQAAKVPEAEAKQLAKEFADSERQRLETTQAMSGAQDSLNASLREAQTILQGIHQQQQLIAGAPFMGADEKSVALMRSYTAEMQKLQQIMASLRAQQAGGGLDPNQLARVNQEFQRVNVQAQQLQQRMAAIASPLRAELSNWAASFGTTMQQIGRTIEQTVGVSLQALNQYLVTGQFNAQALLQQIEMLGLQLIEQMIIQRVMAAVNASAAAGQAAITGPAIATAMAPAATSVTIATEGQAALQAPIAYAGALAAIQAMAVAHEGGNINKALRRFHNGGLSADEVPIIAQEGEFMVQRSVAQQPGAMEFLTALNAGTMHEGGVVTVQSYGGPTEPGQTIGSYDNRLRLGDVAVSPNLLRQWGITPGPNTYITLDGVTYHVADKSYVTGGVPTHNTVEIWGYGDQINRSGVVSGDGAGAPSKSSFFPWRGVAGGEHFRPGWARTGGSRGEGGGRFTGFPGAGGGAGVGGIATSGLGPTTFGEYVGPGQIFIGGVPQIGPGGTNEFMTPSGAIFEQVGPNAYAQTGGIDMGITDQSLPAGAVPISGPAVARPAHYSLGGVPAPSGGPQIFGQGSAGTVFGGYDYFGTMSLRALATGRDPSLGFSWPTFRGRVPVHPSVFRAPGGTAFLGRREGFGSHVALNPDMPKRRMAHGGGIISRLHPGGPVSSGGAAGGPQVHVYAFTDLKALTRHMASREGQKVIFDTVQGRRIDLGLP